MNEREWKSLKADIRSYVSASNTLSGLFREIYGAKIQDLIGGINWWINK